MKNEKENEKEKQKEIMRIAFEDVFFDDVAKEHLNYEKYVDELKKR